jgi:alanine racemase
VVECSHALEAEGATWLGVTSAEEAARLRDAGIGCRILVMAGVWRGEEDTVVRHQLTPIVWLSEQIERLNRAARGQRCRKKLPVHLKVDTGMGRLGVPLAEVEDMARRIAASECLCLEGVCTHMASSEVLDSEPAHVQVARFRQVLEVLRKAGIEPIWRHMANTAAIEGRPNTWNNLVRPGLALYGYKPPLVGNGEPGEPAPSATLSVAPVLAWKTRIISLRQFPPGQAIGYGGSYVTNAPSRIAVLAVGYGDGFRRAMSNQGRVIVGDHYAPVVGTISMDLTTIDVSLIPGVEVGDQVLLLGRSEHCSVTAEDHARWTGTIPYEITCGIAPRVQRIYSGAGAGGKSLP